jgi:hypothetical protein
MVCQLYMKNPKSCGTHLSVISRKMVRRVESENNGPKLFSWDLFSSQQREMDSRESTQSH